MKLVLSVDTWKHMVKIMEIGASVSWKHRSTSITYSGCSVLKTCQLISHVDACTSLAKNRMCMHAHYSEQFV
jgi:hypothetical protein